MTSAFDVSGLATAYRRLVLWFGAQLALGVVQMSMGEAPLPIALAVNLGVLATMVALAYYGYRTAVALGSNAAWLWGVAMLVPCINLITLLVLSSRATGACKAQGVPVGLFGPKV